MFIARSVYFGAYTQILLSNAVFFLFSSGGGGGGLIHFWTFEGRGVLEMGCMGLIERGGLFTHP